MVLKLGLGLYLEGCLPIQADKNSGKFPSDCQLLKIFMLFGFFMHFKKKKKKTHTLLLMRFHHTYSGVLSHLSLTFNSTSFCSTKYLKREMTEHVQNIYILVFNLHHQHSIITLTVKFISWFYGIWILQKRF